MSCMYVPCYGDRGMGRPLDHLASCIRLDQNLEANKPNQVKNVKQLDLGSNIYFKLTKQMIQFKLSQWKNQTMKKIERDFSQWKKSNDGQLSLVYFHTTQLKLIHYWALPSCPSWFAPQAYMPPWPMNWRWSSSVSHTCCNRWKTSWNNTWNVRATLCAVPAETFEIDSPPTSIITGTLVNFNSSGPTPTPWTFTERSIVRLERLALAENLN